MAKKKFFTSQDVWRIRQDQYSYHFEKREAAKRANESTAVYMATVLEQLDKPSLSFFAVSITSDEFKTSIKELSWVPAHLALYWYWSDEGWKAFQDAFNNLDEPTKLSTYVWTDCPQPVYK